MKLGYTLYLPIELIHVCDRELYDYIEQKLKEYENMHIN